MASELRGSQELQIFRRLETHCQERLSSRFIVQMLDSFLHECPHGVNQCLVFELLGPSVNTVLWDYCVNDDKHEPETVLPMSTQLLKAVQFIHRAWMCLLIASNYSTHVASDISGPNIAFTCSHLSTATEEEIFSVIGYPEIEPLARVDGTPLKNGLPTQLVRAAEWVDWIDEDDEEIRLLDIGESFVQGHEPSQLAQPGPLKVPETIFMERFDYRVDLWRTGCMVCRATLSNLVEPVLIARQILDLCFLVHCVSFWYSRSRCRFSFSNDQLCREVTTRLGVTMGVDEVELRPWMG